MGDEPEGVLDGPSPEFKVDKSQQVAKGTVGDGVIDADEAKQAAEESLAAMEKHKKKMADEKEEAKKRELVRAATKGGLGGLASAMAKPKKEEAADKAADRVEGCVAQPKCWHLPSVSGCLQRGRTPRGACRASPPPRTSPHATGCSEGRGCPAWGVWGARVPLLSCHRPHARA